MKRFCTFILVALTLVMLASCSSKEIKTPDWLQGVWVQESGYEEINVTADNIQISTFGQTSVDLKELMTTYENASLDQKTKGETYNVTVINKDTGMGISFGFSLDGDNIKVTVGGQTYTYVKDNG